MSTVQRLLRTRSDLSTLGMGGFLARLLAFVDVNSASLLGTNTYLREFELTGTMPQREPFRLPRPDNVAPGTHRAVQDVQIVNLERFMGLMPIERRVGRDSRPPTSD
jgi:hypothetical protein